MNRPVAPRVVYATWSELTGGGADLHDTVIWSLDQRASLHDTAGLVDHYRVLINTELDRVPGLDGVRFTGEELYGPPEGQGMDRGLLALALGIARESVDLAELARLYDRTSPTYLDHVRPGAPGGLPAYWTRTPIYDCGSGSHGYSCTRRKHTSGQHVCEGPATDGSTVMAIWPYELGLAA